MQQRNTVLQGLILDCLTLGNWTDSLFRNVGHCLWTLRNMPEERRYNAHRSGLSLPNHIWSWLEDHSVDVFSCADSSHMLIWPPKKDGRCTYDVKEWCVRVIFVPSQIYWQPDTVSLEQRHFFGDLMSRPTIKLTQLFVWSAPIFFFAEFKNKSRFFWDRFVTEVTNIKFYGNPSGGSCTDTRG
jgi:hypothetical protein